MKKLYIVLWISKDDKDIGYLPFNCVPIKSILWKYIQSGEKVVSVDGDGIRGIYNDKELALAHLNIESKWRKWDKFKLVVL